MEEPQDIKITSELPDFLLLDAITHTGEKTIAGVRQFSAVPSWLGIEALAQLGAFHVRALMGFKKHAFLLKINHFAFPLSETLQGRYVLQGSLVGRSSGAFVYELQAIQGQKVEFSGNFLYAAVDYDDTLRELQLHDHYLGIFRCLQNATQKSSGAGKRTGFSEPPP